MSSDLYGLRGDVAGLTPKVSVEMIVPEDRQLRRIAGPWRPGAPCRLNQPLAEPAQALIQAWFRRFQQGAHQPERVFALCYLVEGDALALPPAEAAALMDWLRDAFGGRAGAVATADGRAAPTLLATADALAREAAARDLPFTVDVVLDPAAAGTAAGASHLAALSTVRRMLGQIYLALIPQKPLPPVEQVDRLPREADLHVLDLQRHATPQTDGADWRASTAWLAALIQRWAQAPSAYDLTFAMTLACQVRAQPEDLETLHQLLARLLLANLVLDRDGRVGFCQGGLFGTGVPLLPHTGGTAVAQLGRGESPEDVAERLPQLALGLARRLLARHLRDPGCGDCPVMAACALCGGPRLKQVLPRDAATDDCPIAVRGVLEAVAHHEEDISWFPFAWVQKGLTGGVFADSPMGQPMHFSEADIRWPV